MPNSPIVSGSRSQAPISSPGASVGLGRRATIGWRGQVPDEALARAPDPAPDPASVGARLTARLEGELVGLREALAEARTRAATAEARAGEEAANTGQAIAAVEAHNATLKADVETLKAQLANAEGRAEETIRASAAQFAHERAPSRSGARRLQLARRAARSDRRSPLPLAATPGRLMRKPRQKNDNQHDDNDERRAMPPMRRRCRRKPLRPVQPGPRQLHHRPLTAPPDRPPSPAMADRQARAPLAQVYPQAGDQGKTTAETKRH
jgi:hypothetical protein